MPKYTLGVCGPEDRDSFLELLSEVFGADFSRLRMQSWDWIMTGNPASRVQPSEVLILKRDDKTIGGVILLTSLLKAGDRFIPIRWVGSIMTHPKHRGQGLRIVRRLAESLVPVMGFPRYTTEQMYQRFGGAIIGRSSQMFCLIDAGRWVASRKPALSVLAPAIGAIWSPLTAVFTKLLAPSRSGRHAVRILQRFDAEFDRFWEDASRGYGKICVRNKDFLNWRYVDHPKRSYTLYAVYENGHLSGYAVTKLAEGPDFPTGFIVDFLVRVGDHMALSALLNSAISDLKKSGAVVVKFFKMNEPAWFDSVFFRQGFYFRRSHFRMVGHSRDRDIVKKTLATKGWYMTLGDADNEL